MNVASLCAGIGGLELGLGLATGGAACSVVYVEGEAYAAKVLEARMQDGSLAPAPVWDDITTFDGRPWRGVVDCVTAGLPCQPYSIAGRRLGHEDDRALWPHFIRIVEETAPALVFLENVPDFLGHFEPVRRELLRLGFVLPSPLLHTASELGAPHIRKRLFVLAAHPDRIDLRESGRLSGQGGAGSSEPGFDHANVSHAGRDDGKRLLCGHEDATTRRGCAKSSNANGGQSQRGDARAAAERSSSSLALAHSAGRGSEWSGWLFDAERQTLWHDVDGCGYGCRVCGSAWEAESPPVRVDARSTDWVDQLRAAGNSVVPSVAASAFRLLITDALTRLAPARVR